MTGPGEHPCAADNCTTPVPARYPMCLIHWRKLSGGLRRHIRLAYVTGGLDSPDYLQAVLIGVQKLRRRAAEKWYPCPIDGCGRDIPGRLVVCSDCWAFLPVDLRRRVSELRTVPWQPDPSPEVVRKVLDEASRIAQQARAGSGAGS